MILLRLVVIAWDWWREILVAVLVMGLCFAVGDCVGSQGDQMQAGRAA